MIRVFFFLSFITSLSGGYIPITLSFFFILSRTVILGAFEASTIKLAPFFKRKSIEFSIIFFNSSVVFAP